MIADTASKCVTLPSSLLRRYYATYNSLAVVIGFQQWNSEP
jgi:hypothetical protein